MDVSRRQFVGTGLVAAAAFFGLPQIASAQGWRSHQCLHRRCGFRLTVASR
jgi:hypothetical protein